MAVDSIFQEAIAQLSERAGIPFTCDPDLLARASKDFGNLIQGRCHTIVQPHSAEEIVALLHLANQENLPITPRGSGGSQSGQSVSQNGITLDISRLDTIDTVRLPEQAICGAGTTWRQLVAHLGKQGLLPCVMPLNLNLTVGGTLSAGGFGANSHRFSSVVANVAGLEVITGAGNLVSCSTTEKPEIFEASLAGLGRCAVITSATLNLRKIQSQVRTYYLLYEDINTWLEDQQQLAQSQHVDYLEGFCSASIQGLRKTPNGRRPLIHWLYGLHVGVEFEPSHPPQTEQILDSLGYKLLLHTEDDSTNAFSARYDVRFQAMQQSGAWQQSHPWFECLLPLRVAGEAIPQILDLLPPFFGDGHRVILIADKQNPAFFMQPDVSPAVAFAVLPTGIPEAMIKPALNALSQVNDLVLSFGGKRYLSGWLGMMTPDLWKLHYGNQYDRWQNIKQLLDPNHVLRSVLFP
jgi:cytokinin dehydrogenase